MSGNNGQDNKKNEKFLELWSSTGFNPLEKKQCAIDAGFNSRVAKAGANRVIDALIQNRRMQRALRKKGVSMDKIADKIAEQLEAKHPFAPTRPDNLAQLKAADMALKIHDAFPPAKLEIDKRERKEIIISAEVVQRLERYNDQRAIMEKGDFIDVTPVPTQ